MEQPNNLQEAIETINPMFDGMEDYFEATADNPVKGMILSVYDDAALGTHTMHDPEFAERPYVDWVIIDALLFPEEN